MNTNSKRLGAFLAITLLLTAVATTLRTVACLEHLDYAYGFFADKALINAANIIMVITATGAFTYIFAAARINLRASFSTSSTYVPTGILGVATAFIGAKAFSYSVMASNYRLLSIDVLTLKKPAALIGAIVACLAFISIAHHFFNAFITESKAEIRAYFAIATIAFLAFYAILIYLDSSLAIADSSKVLRMTTFLLCAMFFLYEARISLGREMWRVYVAFGLSASALCAYTSIPGIVVYYTKGVILSSAGSKSLASLEEYVLMLALFIFISARLWLTVTLREEKSSDMIKALKEYATEREEKANESFERYQEIFASKQLSIFDLYGGGDIADDSDEADDDEGEKVEIVKDKEPMISDDAIYEAIFGKMPDRDEEVKKVDEEVHEDDRAPEKIAEDLLNAVDEALKKASTDKNKEEK